MSKVHKCTGTLRAHDKQVLLYHNLDSVSFALGIYFTEE